MQCPTPSSKCRRIWDRLLEEKDTLYISNEILNEYEEIIQRLVDKETSDMVINIILNNPSTYLYNPIYKFNLVVADLDDNKFVDCAIIANAKYLVSEDHHFNILRLYDFPKMNVIRLDQYIAEIE